MLTEKQPFNTEAVHPSYLDSEDPSFKDSLKSLYRNSRKICRTLLTGHSALDLTYLMYHSVSDELKAEFVYPPCTISAELFEAQMKHVVDHYNVLSIDEYLEFIGKKATPPKRSLIVSFDDGYLDNLEIALPILEKYKIPAIIYLATRYIDDAEAQWVDRIYNMFKFRTTQNVNIEFLSKKTWDMGDRIEQRTMFSLLNELFITKTYDERAYMLQSLIDSFKYEGSFPRLTLNWDEVRQISEKFTNITLGIHTDQHLDVRTHKNELQQELETSSRKLQKAINKKSEHFSFPYERVFKGAHTLLSEFGIKSAVCSRPDFEVKPECQQYYMTRIDAVKYPLKQWWYTQH